jgi:leucyl-tRNA---protein transferase
MRLLERFVEKPRACAYLSDRNASLEVRVMLDVSPSQMETLLERGWRRFGPIYFRPACAGCCECISLRVLVDRFAPSKSQRRAARACAGLRRVVGVPTTDEARLALYARWHANRERSRGWQPNPQSRERYALEFAFAHESAREAAYYDDDAGGRLVAVGLHDSTPRAISAAFFFYDPGYAHLSLGTANILALIDDARTAAKVHLYLGYCVSGCPSLQYKSAFVPHELLVDRDSAAWASKPASSPEPAP